MRTAPSNHRGRRARELPGRSGGHCAVRRARVALALLLVVTTLALGWPPAPVTAQSGPDAPVQSPYVGPLAGQLREGHFFSHALARDMAYFVYLPPGYGDPEFLFATLYLLHGNSGDKEEWVAYGLIDTVDRMIADGAIDPLVVVLPQGDFSYWVNLVPNGPNYGDYLTEDLVGHIDATYRVLADAEHRAIGGLSMGGTGALIRAFRAPEVFGVVGAHSPALPQEGERPFLGRGRQFERRDPIALAEQAEELEALRIWVDVGDEDDWLPRAEVLDEVLSARDIDHEFHIFPGEHWGGYWSEHLPDYLHFYDSALQAE
jgi:enterochelin esterase-like enzyme